MNGRTMKRRALVSVSDKTGLEDFCRGLVDLGFQIVSTGGTARALEAAGIEVTPVGEITGEPEILGGRVKTLHPRIYAGILADLEDPDHVTQLVEHDVAPIDLVCANLYPFEEAVAKGFPESEAIEQIDIGGPAMTRAAAKNFRSVTVVPAPGFYDEVLGELKTGEVALETRRRLALAAFEMTARYDAAIAGWFSGVGDSEDLPDSLTIRYEKFSGLRYGENPHQRAAYYAEVGEKHLLSGVEQLQGKDLSFNNLYDLESARTLLLELTTDRSGEAAAVIFKHANPCGAAVGDTAREAYTKALASDPTSAFGGIVALDAPVDGELASEISEVFTEVLVAPDFAPEALETFAGKPNLRLLRAGRLVRPRLSGRHVTNGLLLQDDDRVEGTDDYTTATRADPTKKQTEDLLFAWRVARTVKSNAVVLARDGATVGVGAGQMSRVEAAEIAVGKAGERARDSVAASDAFFPFADGLEVLVEAGVSAVIQPGGSKRDAEVIEAADRLGVAMVFTGRRHFLH